MNNIKLTWLTGFVGVSKNWISPQDFMKKIDDEELVKMDSNNLGNIYIDLENSKEFFLKRIESIFSFSDESFNEGLKVWAIYFLNEIKESKEVISKKLKKIANIWAMMNYPESWRSFIYYLPVEDGTETGEEEVYQRFLNFLNTENGKSFDDFK